MTKMTRREGTSGVILYAPWAILLPRRVGHRYAGGPIKSIITRVLPVRLSSRQLYLVAFFMADPPVSARSSRKFVFDEFCPSKVWRGPDFSKNIYLFNGFQ